MIFLPVHAVTGRVRAAELADQPALSGYPAVTALPLGGLLRAAGHPRHLRRHPPRRRVPAGHQDASRAGSGSPSPGRGMVTRAARNRDGSSSRHRGCGGTAARYLSTTSCTASDAVSADALATALRPRMQPRRLVRLLAALVTVRASGRNAFRGSSRGGTGRPASRIRRSACPAKNSALRSVRRLTGAPSL